MTAFMLHLLVYIFIYFLLLNLSCVFSKFAFVIMLYFVCTLFILCLYFVMLLDSLFLCDIEYFKPIIYTFRCDFNYSNILYITYCISGFGRSPTSEPLK